MENQNHQQVELKIADNISGGEYANAMQISHNQDEFHMIFMNLLPPTGKVVSKVITSPGHMKRIIGAMQENLKKYEDQFGEIKESSSPEKTVGFTDRKSD